MCIFGQSRACLARAATTQFIAFRTWGYELKHCILRVDNQQKVIEPAGAILWVPFGKGGGWQAVLPLNADGDALCHRALII